MTRSKEAPKFGRALRDLWRGMTTDLFGAYHPERHYMRGPGPKWRAKHARVAAGEPNLAGMANVSA